MQPINFTPTVKFSDIKSDKYILYRIAKHPETRAYLQKVVVPIDSNFENAYLKIISEWMSDNNTFIGCGGKDRLGNPIYGYNMTTIIFDTDRKNK